MIIVEYKKLLFRIKHVWFADDSDINKILENDKTSSLIYLHGIYNPLKIDGSVLKEQYTITKNLNISLEEMEENLSKSLSRSIKRGSKRNVTIETYYEIDSVKMHFSKLDSLYSKMYKSKKIKKSLNLKLMKEYFAKKSLVLYLIFIDEELIGFQADIFDKKYARAWVGSFDFINELYNNSIIGHIHNYFNWFAITNLKERGVIYYDMGGINSFNKPNSISQYKLKYFCDYDTKDTYFNIIVLRTFFMKFLFKIWTALKK